MTKLTHSLGGKISAIVLWCIAMVGSIGGTLAIMALKSLGFYRVDGTIYWPFGYQMVNGEIEIELVYGYWQWTESTQPVYPQFYRLCYNSRYILIGVAIIAAIAAVFLLIFLMCSAGHHPGKTEAEPNGIDKIPLDIFGLAICGVVGVLTAVMEETYWAAGDIGAIGADLCVDHCVFAGFTFVSDDHSHQI